MDFICSLLSTKQCFTLKLMPKKSSVVTYKFCLNINKNYNHNTFLKTTHGNIRYNNKFTKKIRLNVEIIQIANTECCNVKLEIENKPFKWINLFCYWLYYSINRIIFFIKFFSLGLYVINKFS